MIHQYYDFQGFFVFVTVFMKVLLITGVILIYLFVVYCLLTNIVEFHFFPPRTLNRWPLQAFLVTHITVKIVGHSTNCKQFFFSSMGFCYHTNYQVSLIAQTDKKFSKKLSFGQTPKIEKIKRSLKFILSPSRSLKFISSGKFIPSGTCYELQPALFLLITTAAFNCILQGHGKSA